MMDRLNHLSYLALLGILQATLGYDYDRVTLTTQSFPETTKLEAQYCSFDQQLVSRDERYLESTVGFNNAVNEDVFPQQILYPTTIQQVSEALQASADLPNDSQVCVRACGSSFAGFSAACDKGTIIDLSQLSATGNFPDIEYSKSEGLITIGAAVKQEEVLVYLNSRGRALPLGSWLGTCVSGFTLGGGVSGVSRAYGLACDHLVELTILLPGQSDPVVATKDNMHKDIFWASCGGGGGLGVVVSMTFMTYPEHQVVIWEDLIVVSEVDAVLRWWYGPDSNLHDINRSKVGLSIEMNSFENADYEKDVARMKLLYPVEDAFDLDDTVYNFKMLLLSFWPWKNNLKVQKHSFAQHSLQAFYTEALEPQRCGQWGRHKSQLYEKITMDDITSISSHLASKWGVLPNFEYLVTRRVGITAWGSAIGKETSRDSAFWGRDAGFEVNLAVDYKPTKPYDAFQGSLCVNQANKGIWDAVCESWVYFNFKRWAEGWLHVTSSALCHGSNDPMCKYSFINHISEFGNDSKAYFGGHLSRLENIKTKHDPTNKIFASWQKVEKGENAYGQNNPGRIEKVKTFESHPMKVMGYLPLYDDLPAKAELEKYDVLFLFAATTLAREQEGGDTRYTCTPTCELSFPDSSEDVFKEYSDHVTQIEDVDVLLTVGGAAMGGCWKYCFGKEAMLAYKIAEYVDDNGLDGVDFNIEDPPSSDLFQFIETLVKKTHTALSAKREEKKWLMTHSPLSQYLDRILDTGDSERFHGLSYNSVYQSLNEQGYLSFIFAQYYNSWPIASIASKNQFYESFVGHTKRMQDIYGFNKIVVGMCSGGCQRPSIVEGNEVTEILDYLKRPFDNNIGAAGVGFWKVTADETSRIVNKLSDMIASSTYKGYLKERYPNCDVANVYEIGDAYCDDGAYNTNACGWDDEDCTVPSAAPSSMPSVKYPDCPISLQEKIGDGICDGGRYNSERCGWDGGDCLTFNAHFPNCDVEVPSKIADGICDEDYSTAACWWDGGDCEKPKIETTSTNTALLTDTVTSAGSAIHYFGSWPKYISILLVTTYVFI